MKTLELTANEALLIRKALGFTSAMLDMKTDDPALYEQHVRLIRKTIAVHEQAWLSMEAPE